MFIGWNLSCFAQENSETSHGKNINFGIKGGFNTAMYFIDEFKIKDITIDEIQNNYSFTGFGDIWLFCQCTE